MSGPSSRITVRRDRLVAQSALQRMALARGIEPLRPSLALADQGLAALRYIKAHPGWVVGGVILLALVRSRGGGKWLGRGWMTWQIANALRVV